MSFRRIDIDIGSDNGSITLFFDRGILSLRRFHKETGQFDSL